MQVVKATILLLKMDIQVPGSKLHAKLDMQECFVFHAQLELSNLIMDSVLVLNVITSQKMQAIPKMFKLLPTAPMR